MRLPPSPEALSERLRALALVSGASLVGFADLESVADLPRGVVIAIAHSPQVFTTPDEMPTYGYYQEYLDLNRRLDDVARIIAEVLAGAGHAVSVNPATLGSLEAQTLAAPFPHKTAATRAGLGWIGKSALLVTPQLGPALRLTSVLTDAPLAVGERMTYGRCGDCTACEEACPAGAILGEEWYAGRPREEFYDAFACRQTALERARARGIEQTICGICMLVCPRRPTL